MSEEHDDLVEAAWAVREHAYAPYSDFRVGAAVRAGSGRIYVGANVENASYPVGCCAERSAVCAAVSAGERELRAIAIVAGREEPTTPCGLCRQTLREFARDMDVLCVGLHGRTLRTRLADLLPHGFGPADLDR